VDANHDVLAITFEDKVNFLLRVVLEKQPPKKDLMCLALNY
jgi:hypothetical protein